MPAVSITEVSQNTLPEEVLAAAVESPVTGGSSETFSFTVRGWAIGRDSEVDVFQLRQGDYVAAEVPPNRTITTSEEDLKTVNGREASGFETLVRAIEISPAFEIEVVAGLQDGTRCTIGTIAGRRELLIPPRQPALNPAMITTIGRSGSKWLAWLMSCHPEVIAFQPLVFEPRVATYWMTVLRALTAPKSYLRQIHTERWEEPRWWLGDGATGLPAPVDLAMAEWLGIDSIRALAAICQERTEVFYEEVARRSGKEAGVRYFAEKFLLDPALLELATEVFPSAREVILVRDFRDRLSSVFAWNERRGEAGFGHEADMSKAEYLAERVRLDAQGLLNRWRVREASALLLRYEDLILEPEVSLKRLFDYLDVAADDEAVASVLNVASQPTSLLDKHRTVSDPAQTIGRWRRDLPKELAVKCNELLGPTLEAFGYSTDLAEATESG